MSARVRRAKQLALACAATALSLGGVELGFRAAGIGSPVSLDDVVMSWEPSSPFRASEHRSIGIELERSWSGRLVYRRAADGVEVAASEVRTSSRGLRGADPPEPRPDGRIRVLALGDSVTFGQGVAEPETFVAIAGRVLAADHPVELLNAGVPSWDLRQQAHWLTLVGRYLQPDLVVQLFFLNDALPPETPTDLEHTSMRREAPPWARRESGLRRWSWTYNHACRVRDLRRAAADLLPAGDHHWLDAARRDDARERVTRHYRELAASCAGAGVPCVAALLPPLVADPNDQGWDVIAMAADAAAGAGLPVVHLEHSLDELTLPDRFVMPGDPHPGPAAHRAIAEALIAAIDPLLAAPPPDPPDAEAPRLPSRAAPAGAPVR